MQGTPNILVISDLHLGEDIGALHPEHMDLGLVEQQLTAFIEHHGAHPAGGRPWRLIINGDMVDFLAMRLMPADVGLLTGIDEDDHLYGLGTTAPAALAKVDAVVDRHPEVFAALARFVDAGHFVAIVIGNHDVEFHWKEVQQRLRERLQATLTNTTSFNERLSFHPWFFWEDGVWVEHGHLYDPYCTVEDVLDPFTDDGTDVDPSLSASLMRYVNNHYAPHSGHDEPWSFAAYFVWFFRQGGWRMWDIVGAFGRMTQRILQTAGRLASPSKMRQARRAKRLPRLRRLAQRFQLDPVAVHSVDKLTRIPVVIDRTRVLRSLMLDRLALMALAGCAVLTLLVMSSWPVFGVVTALIAVGLWRAHLHLSATTAPHVNTAQLTKVAREIRKRMAAKIVVFGHTHEPVAQQEEGGWTFNTGSWVPDGVDNDRAFTHLRIVRGAKDRLHATLRRWTKGRSIPFVPATSQTG
jgi:UDP-2,3-diacylglucosamine pyrophosphatase LpxH